MTWTTNNNKQTNKLQNKFAKPVLMQSGHWLGRDGARTHARTQLAESAHNYDKLARLLNRITIAVVQPPTMRGTVDAVACMPVHSNCVEIEITRSAHRNASRAPVFKCELTFPLGAHEHARRFFRWNSNQHTHPPHTHHTSARRFTRDATVS